MPVCSSQQTVTAEHGRGAVFPRWPDWLQKCFLVRGREEGHPLSLGRIHSFLSQLLIPTGYSSPLASLKRLKSSDCGTQTPGCELCPSVWVWVMCLFSHLKMQVKAIISSWCLGENSSKRTQAAYQYLTHAGGFLSINKRAYIPLPFIPLGTWGSHLIIKQAQAREGCLKLRFLVAGSSGGGLRAM